MASCASTSLPGRAARPDLRGRTAVSTPTPRLLVTGPVRLLHANFDRRAGVAFFKAAQTDATGAIDCGGSAPVGWDGETDLEIREGEGICVAAARDVNLFWHARTGVDAPVPTQHAKR
jgi:hypothetical protein